MNEADIAPDDNYNSNLIMFLKMKSRVVPSGAAAVRMGSSTSVRPSSDRCFNASEEAFTCSKHNTCVEQAALQSLSSCGRVRIRRGFPHIVFQPRSSDAFPRTRK